MGVGKCSETGSKGMAAAGLVQGLAGGHGGQVSKGQLNRWGRGALHGRVWVGWWSRGVQGLGTLMRWQRGASCGSESCPVRY